jgi:hypothetical protein
MLSNFLSKLITLFFVVSSECSRNGKTPFRGSMLLPSSGSKFTRSCTQNATRNNDRRDNLMSLSIYTSDVSE